MHNMNCYAKNRLYKMWIAMKKLNLYEIYKVIRHDVIQIMKLCKMWKDLSDFLLCNWLIESYIILVQ